MLGTVQLRVGTLQLSAGSSRSSGDKHPRLNDAESRSIGQHSAARSSSVRGSDAGPDGAGGPSRQLSVGISARIAGSTTFTGAHVAGTATGRRGD